MKTARQLAAETLLRIEKNGAYSNIALNAALSSNELGEADRALLTALVYGTEERLITIDYNLSLYLKRPAERLPDLVLMILRLGAWQLLFADRIPDRAAIFESVELSKKLGFSFASGLINAVLRRLASEGLRLPPENETEPEAYLSIKYSCPVELVRLLCSSYGEEETRALLEAFFEKRPTALRVNTLLVTPEELLSQLKGVGISARRHEKLENALLVEAGTSSLCGLEAFKKGFFHIQDSASQFACERLGAGKEERIFDMCAAPGGKSFTLAEKARDKAKIFAFELHEQRAGLIRSGAERLHLSSLNCLVRDASRFYDDLGLADRVLCDVPCSGIGVIGSKPELRRRACENIDKLRKLQYYILTNSSKYLREGGSLVYSTCTLNPRENEENVYAFLKENKDFELNSLETLMPNRDGCDGFFIAAMTRTARR